MSRRPSKDWFFCFCLSFLIPTLLVAGGKALGEEENSAGPNNSPVYFNRLFLQPQARLNEPSQGSWGPILWAAGLKTRFSNWLDVQAVFGSSNLLYRPLWTPAPSETVSLLEGVGTIHAVFGDIYMGQFLVPWGLEGSSEEEELFFPRTLLYERGQFPLRDIGAGFKTEADGYYMNLASHNGEGASTLNQDNRVFVTGQFGYRGAAHSNLGMSITAGRVASPNLSPEQKIRGGNAFFGFNIFGLGLQIEGSYFQTFSDSGNTDILAWHADLEHPVTDWVNILARYEQFNPSVRTAANIQGRGYLGTEVHSRDNSSRLFLYLVKNNESLQETPNDGILAVWRFSPQVE